MAHPRSRSGAVTAIALCAALLAAACAGEVPDLPAPGDADPNAPDGAAPGGPDADPAAADAAPGPPDARPAPDGPAPVPDAPVSHVDNPYLGHPHWCKGAVHDHTTNSDGGDTPTEMAQAYLAKGYDFIFFTDHNHVTPDPGVAGLVVLEGEEVGTTSGHSNALGVSSLIAGGQSRQATIDAAAAQGALLQINHPSRDGVTKAHLDGLTGLWGFEVRNEGNSQPGDVTLWDGQISQGKRLWATFSDDAHSVSATGRGWVVVNSDDPGCGRDAVVDNLARGNFYCSEGPQLAISVAGDTITVVSDTGVSVEWLEQGLASVRATVAAGDSYTLEGGELFVRAVVTDAGGKMAWTQPFFRREP